MFDVNMSKVIVYSHTILLLKHHNDHQSKVHPVLNNYVYNIKSRSSQACTVFSYSSFSVNETENVVLLADSGIGNCSGKMKWLVLFHFHPLLCVETLLERGGAEQNLITNQLQWLSL